MTRQTWVCDDCTSEFTSPLAAAMCCDALNDIDDEWRGYS